MSCYSIEVAFIYCFRNKKLSRLDTDESISHLDSIRESPVLNERCGQPTIDQRTSTPEANCGGRRPARQKNSKKQEEIIDNNAERNKTARSEAEEKTAERQEKVVTIQIEGYAQHGGEKEGGQNETEANKEAAKKDDVGMETRLTDKNNTEVQRVTEENNLIQVDEQVVNDTSKENVPPRRCALDYHKLSEEFKLKECSIMLGQQPSSLNPTALDTMTVQPLVTNNGQVEFKFFFHNCVYLNSVRI
jgi:hypothetical protein